MFDDPGFVNKMSALEKRYDEVSGLLGQPEVISKRQEFTKLSKEHSELSDLVAAWRQYTELITQRDEAKAMVESETDPELRDLAREELTSLAEALTKKEHEIKLMLLPKDPDDEKNIMLEIRAGTGGSEAALFAGDLYRMYMRFAERKHWKTEIMNTSEGPAGGVKEVVVLIEGKEVFSHLKYESGVHRVQRVPSTESSGRIHTSAATVAVLPEVPEIELKIDDKDLRIDVKRAGGPGGQSVNTTDSAVRIIHLPTNITVECQDEKSQHKNKAKAMRVLRSRLYDHEREKRDAIERDKRRSMVKSGDRSEKVRTYNFPQDRMTDHRISLTKRNLSGILDGDLQDTILALRAYYQAQALKDQAES